MPIDIWKLLGMAKKEYFDFNCFKMPIIDTPAYHYMLAVTLLEIWGDRLYGFQDYTEGAYEIGEVKVSKNDVVLDCGANLGLFSLLAAYEGAKVYAIEPLEENIKCLEKVNMLNPWANIEVLQTAVANYNGMGKFYVNSGDLGNATIEGELTNGRRADVELLIKMSTIDELVKTNNIQKVDFIKADIEGAEEHMLQGAKETLKRFKPKLAICTYHTPTGKEDIERIIMAANPDYKIIHKWNKLFAY